ncbi:MAG: sensor histidine kinase [Actinobacteria bacterium]|nr:sensor histidine kinase [Actinomycetota bacterium]
MIASITASPRDLIVRVTAILLIAAMAGHLASEQRAKARHIALLHQALISVAGERDPSALRTAAVAWARRLTDAATAALVPPDRDPHRTVIDPPGASPALTTLPIEEAGMAGHPLIWARGSGPEGAILISLGDAAGVLLVQGTNEAFSATHQYLLETLAAQTAVALETARLHEGLRQKERARAALIHELVRAQEEERRRIARELHDGTSQDLAGVVVGLEALERSPGTVEIGELKQLARSVADELRSLILDLRPRVLDDLGLSAALRWLAHERHPGLSVKLDLPPDTLPPPLDTAVFRIVQEALTNVERHAGANRVTVSLRVGGGRVRAAVEDDGRGLDMGGKADGFGILGMRERAEQLGGRLSVNSTPGGGTVVEVELPLEG